MAKIRLPADPGRFKIAKASAGSYMVRNDRTGKNEVIIPCRDRDQAEDICKRLNEGDHSGEIWV